jgi:hypothetical protein
MLAFFTLVPFIGAEVGEQKSNSKYPVIYHT